MEARLDRLESSGRRPDAQCRLVCVVGFVGARCGDDHPGQVRVCHRQGDRCQRSPRPLAERRRSFATAIAVPAERTTPTSYHATPVDVNSRLRPNYMKLSVDGMPDGAWQPFATSATVTLPPGEGERMVRCYFSDDQQTVSNEVTDTIVVESAASEPDDHFAADGFEVTGAAITGTATDAGAAGLKSVHLVISSLDHDGATWYWTGSDWSLSSYGASRLGQREQLDIQQCAPGRQVALRADDHRSDRARQRWQRCGRPRSSRWTSPTR